MPDPRPHLIIPSELQVREFDSKLLLACLAAERGYPSVVGSRVEIHNRITGLPRGIYLAKDAPGTRTAPRTGASASPASVFPR
jgi:hypothetical protein